MHPILALVVACTCSVHAVPDPAADASQVVIPPSGVLALQSLPPTLVVEDATVRVRVEGTELSETWELSVLNRAHRPELFVVALPVGAEADLVGVAGLPERPDVPRPILFDGADALEFWKRLAAETSSRRPLEWAGHGCVHVPEVPVASAGRLRLAVTLRSTVPATGDLRIEVPRSELPEVGAPNLRFELEATDPARWSWLHSPTHDVQVEQGADGLRASARVDAASQPGPLVSLLAAARPTWNLALLAERDPTGGATLFAIYGRPDPPQAVDGLEPVTAPREMTLVIDRSGSMSGVKIRQARDAAQQFLANVADHDRFQLVSYAKDVTALFDEPLVASRENRSRAEAYIAQLSAGGSTNLSGALEAALGPSVEHRHLPYVLLLSDGQPTTGVTEERPLLELARARNAWGRRLYTFGIGDDVNAPLLDGLAHTTRGASAYVRPSEDVEPAVERCVVGLRAPLWTSLELHARAPDGASADHLLRRVPGGPLPDLFDGEVLFVLGRLEGDAPVDLVLSGRSLGFPREVTLRLDPAAQPPGSGALATLYAARRSAELLDRIRASGASEQDPAALRRVQDEMRELLALSLESGVLNAYTTFLSLPDTDLLGYEELLGRLTAMLTNQAIRTRVGRAAVSDALAIGADRERRIAERVRRSLADAGRPVQLANVACVAGRGLFRRGATWIDGACLGPGSTATIDERVEAGTARYAELVAELATEGRCALLALPGSVVVRWRGRTVAVAGT